MNMKLNHTMDFSAVIFDEDRIYPNTFEVKINFNINTDNPIHQNVAIQRIVFLIHEVIDKSIFINQNNPALSKVTRLAGSNNIVVTMPDEPFDQILGIMLFHKLSVITEEKFDIDTLEICGGDTGELRYIVDDFTEFPITMGKYSAPYWWDRSDLTVSENKKSPLYKVTWETINLGWDETDELVFEPELASEESTIHILDGGEDIDGVESDES